MSELPRSLQPWAAELALFPRDLAATLGAWLGRLAAALGPLAPRALEATHGALEGYDGLARRGPLERLLHSEWLYALELPEEGLRRAVMGEQAFLRPAYREPAGALRSTVLFDAGPEQLGGPRLVHLALLVLLHRRARAAGAAFRWGVLQRPEAGEADVALDEGAVRALLGARSLEAAGETHVNAWRAHLPAADGRGELWVVGGAGAAPVAAALGGALVRVDEPAEPERRELLVSVRPRGGALPREVRLALPAPATSVRLLRDPFSPAETARRRDARPPAQSGNRVVLPVDGCTLALGMFGQDLLLRQRDGKVVGLRIPRGPRGGAPRPRIRGVYGDARLLGVGARLRGGMVILTLRSNGCLVLDGSPTVRGSGEALGQLPAGSPFQPPQVAHGFAAFATDLTRPGGLALRDARGDVYDVVVASEGHVALAPRPWPRTTALFSGPGGLVAVAAPPHPADKAVHVQGAGFSLQSLPEGDGDRHAFLGHGQSGHPQLGVLAVRMWATPSERWLVRGRTDVLLAPPSGARVVGVGSMRRHGADVPALLVLGEDERTLVLMSQHGDQPLAVAPEPVLQVHCAWGTYAFAILTTSGRVLVLSPHHEAPLLDVVSELEP